MQEAKKILDRSLLANELFKVAKAMALYRSPGQDGFLVAFYTKFWNLIGSEFIAMVQLSLQVSHHLCGMNRGFIALLFKASEREDLSNWHPITLLNVSYKIVTKALQRKLQPFLSKVISPDQTAFLPTHYILDNILV